MGQLRIVKVSQWKPSIHKQKPASEATNKFAQGNKQHPAKEWLHCFLMGGEIMLSHVHTSNILDLGDKFEKR